MIKKLIIWYILLTKRWFKRISFWLILLCVPLLVLGMKGISGQDAAALKMAVYVEPSEDPLGERLAETLENMDGIIRYERCRSEDEVRAKVQYGQADGVYIIPAQLTQMICAYVSGDERSLPYDRHLIRFVAGEDNVQLKLAREQFYGAIFPYISRAVTESFTFEEAGNAGESEAQENQSQTGSTQLQAGENKADLQALYDENQVQGSIFEFALGTTKNTVDMDEVNYLTTPLRGLLALFVFMAGMVMALYFIKDRQSGLFDRLPGKLRPLVAWLYIFSGTLVCGIAAFVGLYFSGSFTTWGKELLLMALLVLAVTGFSWILGTVTDRVAIVGCLAPLLVLISVVVCPVFFGLHGLKPLKYCLPPYFYLAGLHSPELIGCLVIYVVCVTAAGIFLQWRKYLFSFFSANDIID